MADKSLLIGDQAAELLLSYAALIAQIGRGDRVDVQAIGVDGSEVTVGFLLNSGTVLLIESSNNSAVPDPDNQRAIDYMQSRIDNYTRPAGEASPFNVVETED